MQWQAPTKTLRALGLALALFASGALAAVGVNKSFTPNSVIAGQVSVLTIVLLNPNAAAATGVALTDTLPANVVVANPLTIGSNTCGFTVTATPGQRPVALSAGTIPGITGGVPGQCQLTVNIVSSTPNTYLNTIAAGSVASSQGTNPQDAQATLVVSAPANITGTKAFVPNNVHGNGAASTLTISLTNPNPVALTNAALTDTLPATLNIAGTPNASTTCGTGTATATASNPATIALTGGTIPASGSCTIKVDVIARNPNAATNGSSTNTIAAGALTTTEGATSPAISGAVTVQTGSSLAKAFAPNPIPAGGTTPSTMTITINNFNGSILTPITFTDSWAATMTVNGVPSTTCGGVLTNTATSVTLTGGSLGAAPVAAGATSCTITVPVLATATTVNTIPAGTFGSVAHAAASGTLTVTSITGSKSFTVPAVQTGSTTMTITLNNLASTAAIITTLTDQLTTMGAGFTVPSGAVPGGTCGSTLTSPTPGTLITLVGGTIPANGSCTITLPVAISATSATGNRTDTIAVNGVVTTQGNNTTTITGVVNVQRALTVAKAFSPATVQSGTTSRLTVTLTRTGGAAALSNIGFTDLLTTMGAGFVVATPANAATTCTGGTVTASSGTTSFSLAGGSLAGGAANTSCTVTLDVATPVAGPTGTHTNNIPANAVTTAEGVTNANVNANLVLVNTSVTANKSFNPTTVAVGGTSTMSVQIRNNNAGAINLTGVGFTDNLPAGMVVANPPAPTFTGAGCGGAAITAVNNSATVTLSGANVNANSICTLAVTVRANVSGNLINTIPPGAVASTQGVTNPLQGTATLAATGVVNLNVIKTDGVATVVPGGTTTYTISVSNSGPNSVAGLIVNDTPPAGVTFGAWTCVPAGGAFCGSGSGPISDTVSIPNGGSITYTVPATIAPNAVGSITNTATLAVPGSVINNGNSSASDTDTLTPVADLAVTKTDGVATIVPGAPVTYTIVASNAGPSDAIGATVADTLPAAILGATWTCAGAGGGTCPAAGSGDINALVDLPVGASVTFTVMGTVSAAAVGTLSNTATVAAPAGVTDPNPGNNSATDSDTLTPIADLAITKTDGAATAVPGTPVIYTIVASNAGPSAVTGATVTDTLPAVLTAATWTCVGAGGGSCPASGVGNIGASVNLPVGATATFTLTATVSAAAMGTLSNTAAVNVPAGVTDPNPGNNSATDTDTLAAQVSLGVAKTDGSATYAPGGTATYTVTVTNGGPSSATNVTVADALPAGLTLTANATCVASGTASCGTVTGTAGQTSFGATGASVGTGAADSLAFTAPVAFASGMTTDPLINTATAIDLNASGAGSSASGSDSDTRSAAVTLLVTKTDGATTYTPGGTATYTITVENAGVSDALDVSVADALPSGLALTADATCAANGTSSCGTVTGTAGQTSFGTTGARVDAGGANTLVFTVPVAFSAAMTTDPLVNTASATDVPTGATASGSDADALSAAVTLAVAKTDGGATYTPGGTATYAVTISNTGLTDALNVTVSDPLPAGLTLSANATCVANGTSSCGTVTGTTGQTSFGATGARVDAGGANTLVFTAPVAFAAAMTADPLVNTASATDLASGNAANGSDSDTLSPAVTLGVAKTDGSATYTPGGAATYTVTVANTGLSDALNVTVADSLPAGVTLSANATCAANGTSSCGSVTGTAGQVSFGATSARVDAGAGNTLVFTAPVGFAAALTTSPLINTASATDLATGITANGSDSDVLSANVSLAVTKTDGSATYTPGGAATYTVTVSNTGASDALDVTVADALPAGVTLTANAACVANGVASCGTVTGTSGQTSFGTTGAGIGAGPGNSLVFAVPVAFAAGMTTDPLVNTASATDVASGASANGSDSDALASNVALGVTKTDGSATYTPGGTATYTVTVTNTGVSDAVDVTVSDPLPAGVTLAANATCVANGTSSCGAVAGTTGQTSFGATAARINMGGANSLVFTAPVAFAASMTTNPLVNTATAADAVSGATANGSDSDALAAASGLSVGKTDGSASYVPGGGATYTIVVMNAGPSNAGSVTVTDPLPAGVTLAAGATCVAVGTATCGTVAGAAGGTSFGTTGATLAAGAGNSLTFTVPVRFAASLATDPLVNTVTVTDPSILVPASASDSDVRSPMADVGVVKTGPATLGPGGAIAYALTITNAGPSIADGATFTDIVPAAVLGVTASCGGATGGAVCGAVNVAGNTVTGVVAALPAGGSVVIAISGTVSGTGTVINTATVTPPTGTTDPAPANATSSVSTVVGAAATVAVPVDATWALALLIVLVAWLGAQRAATRRAGVRR